MDAHGGFDARIRQLWIPAAFLIDRAPRDMSPVRYRPSRDTRLTRAARLAHLGAGLLLAEAALDHHQEGLDQVCEHGALRGGDERLRRHPGHQLDLRIETM